MPLGILLVLLMLTSVMSYMSIIKKQTDSLKGNHSVFNSTNNTFDDYRGYGSQFYIGDITRDSDKEKREAIETAFIRTCRTISTIAHSNSCADWNKASAIWEFTGSIGGVDSLDSAMTGSTSSTFTCSTMDDYGRWLIQSGIPSSYIVGEGYLYDFTGMNDDNSDACGYIDIIRE